MTASPLVDAVRRTLTADPGPGRFDAALAAVVGHFGADMGMIHRLDPSDRHLDLVATTAGVPEPVLQAARRIPLGKGIAGETALTGKPVRLPFTANIAGRFELELHQTDTLLAVIEVKP